MNGSDYDVQTVKFYFFISSSLNHLLTDALAKEKNLNECIHIDGRINIIKILDIDMNI